MDDLGLLLEELQGVCDWWYNLGLQLGVSPETLDRMRDRVFWPHYHCPSDELREMLKTWLTTSDNPSWKTISDALRSPRVGANRLAGCLERKYCLTKEMCESKQLTLAVSRDKDGQSVALSCDNVLLVYAE